MLNTEHSICIICRGIDSRTALIGEAGEESSVIWRFQRLVSAWLGMPRARPRDARTHDAQNFPRALTRSWTDSLARRISDHLPVLADIRID